MRYKKVSAEELENSKEEYIGGFVMDVQKPRTVANFALNIERYNLPEDFYENYIKNIKAVTLDDVQNAAIKYFRGDQARIVITGKGIDVLKNLENTDYVIKYFDKEGNPTVKPPMTLPIPAGMTAARGQKMDMQQAQIDEAKANLVPFSDMAYKKGTLDRIEPIDGVNYYVVQFNDTEVFYDMKTGLKAKEVKTVKTPDGKEVKVPTTFGNYKAVNGVLFPYSVGIKSGPMDLNFEVKEIKVNEGVTDADFE
jgi:hypothetical protein